MSLLVKRGFFFALTVEIDNCVVVAGIHAHFLLPTTDGVIEHAFVMQQKVIFKPCSHVTSVFAYYVKNSRMWSMATSDFIHTSRLHFENETAKRQEKRKHRRYM